MYNFKRMRRASQTIEVAFAIIATLCILFLTLNMFSDNIKTFIDHGGFPSTWNSSAQKTSDQSWKIGQNQLTREEITTPEVQATSWDAILQNHNDKAIRNINNLYAQVQRQIQANSTDTQLPDGDKKLLAMWLAIYANSSKDSGYYNTLSKLQLNYENNATNALAFGKDMGVTFYNDSILYVKDSKGNNTKYKWVNSTPGVSGGDINTDAQYRVENIRGTNGIIAQFN